MHANDTRLQSETIEHLRVLLTVHGELPPKNEQGRFSVNGQVSSASFRTQSENKQFFHRGLLASQNHHDSEELGRSTQVKMPPASSSSPKE
jgi:hypothetical protein